MKLKNILLAGALLLGLSLCSIVDAQSTLRNKSAGDTRESAMYKALIDVLNTDGTMNHTGASSHTGAETHTGIETHTGAETHTGLETFGKISHTALTITPDDSDGAAVNMITAGVVSVDVGAVVNGVTDYIVLPSLASVSAGHTITICCNAGGAFEVRTPATSGELINSVDSDGTQEWLATDTNIAIVRKLSDTDGWILLEYDTLGVVVAAHAPN